MFLQSIYTTPQLKIDTVDYLSICTSWSFTTEFNLCLFIQTFVSSSCWHFYQEYFRRELESLCGIRHKNGGRYKREDVFLLYKFYLGWMGQKVLQTNTLLKSHFRLMQVVRSGSQICNQCYKWHHLVAKYASGATHYPVANFASGILRPNLQSMRKLELRTRQPGNVYPFRPISLRNHSLIIDKSLGGWKSVSHFVNKIISLIFLQHQVHWSA